MYSGNRLSGYGYRDTSCDNLKAWLSVGAMGVVGTICAVIAFANIGELNGRIERLDSGKSYAFNSVAGCMEATGSSQQACADSMADANRIAQGVGTKHWYAFQASCLATHGYCIEDIDCDEDSCTSTYYPRVAGWQAKPDLSDAVPLYTTPADDLLIRKDNRTFLPGPQF